MDAARAKEFGVIDKVNNFHYHANCVMSSEVGAAEGLSGGFSN